MRKWHQRYAIYQWPKSALVELFTGRISYSGILLLPFTVKLENIYHIRSLLFPSLSCRLLYSTTENQSYMYIMLNTFKFRKHAVFLTLAIHRSGPLPCILHVYDSSYKFATPTWSNTFHDFIFNSLKQFPILLFIYENTTFCGYCIMISAFYEVK